MQNNKSGTQIVPKRPDVVKNKFKFLTEFMTKEEVAYLRSVKKKQEAFRLKQLGLF